MAALIVAGFVGSALLKMSHHADMSSGMYEGSELARSAVNAGFQKALSRLEDREHIDDIVEILNGWLPTATSTSRTGKVRWLLQDADGTYNEKYHNLSSEMEYRVEIVGFDAKTFDIAIQSEARSARGTRTKARAVGVFRLKGLGYEKVNTNWADGDAIHIEDGIELEFLAPITVIGGVRLSANTSFGANASGSIFRGPFRTEDDPNATMDFNGNYTFGSSAYFGTKPNWLNQSLTVPDPHGHVAGATKQIEIPLQVSVTGKSGFPYGDRIDERGAVVTLSDSSFWMDESVARDWVRSPAFSQHNFNGKAVTYNDEFEMNDLLVNYDEENSIEDLDRKRICQSLGIASDPCQLQLNLDAIPDEVIFDISNEYLTPEKMNSAYGGGVALWKDEFLVLHIPKGKRKNVGESVDEVTAKVIILVEGTLQPSGTGGGNAGKAFSVAVDVMDNPDGIGQIVNPANSGHVTIIACNGGRVMNWGGWPSRFRGLYYRQSGGEIEVGGSENGGAGNFFGGIYAEAGGPAIDWYPRVDPVNPTITYDPTVFEELAAVGLISKVGDECSGPEEIITEKLVLTRDIVTTELLSRVY